MGIPKQGPVIAIDGPAGTGKSSVTKRLAQVLGFTYVDTGALYRGIALLGLEKQKDSAQSEIEIAISTSRSVHLEFRIHLNKNPVNRLFADGRDITDLIRTPEVSMAASRISAIPEVRAALLGLQRRLGCTGKAILEGRDIGTVIFPDADIKFFLTASVDERAKRRLLELELTGKEKPSFEEVKAQIHERDQGDINRTIAPLKKAQDAIVLDTGTMTLDEVVKKMETIVRTRLGSIV